MPRDRERWHLTMKSWEDRLELLRDILRGGYSEYTIDLLCEVLKVTPEERPLYFGDS